MTTDPRKDPRIVHGLIPLMAVLRKKRLLEEQRRRAATEVPLPEGADDQPRPRKKRGWIW